MDGDMDACVCMNFDGKILFDGFLMEGAWGVTGSSADDGWHDDGSPLWKRGLVRA